MSARPKWLGEHLGEIGRPVHEYTGRPGPGCLGFCHASSTCGHHAMLVLVFITTSAGQLSGGSRSSRPKLNFSLLPA